MSESLSDTTANGPSNVYTQKQLDRTIAYLKDREAQLLPQANWFEQAAIQRYLTDAVIQHFAEGVLTAALTEPA